MNLYFDCRFGAAGDMLLAALLDTGVDRERLIADLQTLGAAGWELKIAREKRGGISGTRIEVIDHSFAANDSHQAAHTHEPHHHHEHSHAETHPKNLETSSAPPAKARHLDDFLAALANANFSPITKARAEKVFRLLAEVEGQIHGLAPEKVHFHEISGVDSLIDICGVCLAIEYLGAEKISGSPVETGGGLVKCAHGLMPVPAPATLEILRRGAIPFTSGLAEKELLTPTGAALLATLVDEWRPAIPNGAIHAIGYGAGNADFPDHANIVRAALIDNAETAGLNPHGWRDEKIGEIRFAVDDLTGEQIGFFTEKLRACGAVEVYVIAAAMKKNRVGHEIVILIPVEKRDQIFTLIFNDGITLGLRYQEIERAVLPRQIATRVVRGETVALKTGTLADKIVYQKIECDDIARLAQRWQISFGAAQREIAENLRAASREN